MLGGLCILVGTTIWHVRRDEILISHVGDGMSVAEVVALLGEPDYRFEASQFDDDRLLMPENESCRSHVAAYLVYKRRLRRSFFVYVDSAGEVQCTARLTVYGLDPII